MDDIFRYDPAASGTKGLVFIGDKLLIYRRDNNTDLFPLYLDLPGGGSEGEETPFQTLQRELKEEFGLSITASDIVYAKKYQSSLSPDKTAYFVVVQLAAKVKNDIVFGDEGLEYMLMTPKEYLGRTDAWPAIQNRARDYFQSLS